MNDRSHEKKDIAARFNFPSSTLSELKKNQVEIEKRVNEGSNALVRERE